MISNRTTYKQHIIIIIFNIVAGVLRVWPGTVVALQAGAWPRCWRTLLLASHTPIWLDYLCFIIVKRTCYYLASPCQAIPLAFSSAPPFWIPVPPANAVVHNLNNIVNTLANHEWFTYMLSSRINKG